MRIYLFIAFFCSGMPSLLECATITLRMRPYPQVRKTIRRLKKTGIIAQTTLSYLVNPSQSSGIFATYGGFLEVSDHFGDIIFPRKQVNPVLQVLVTNRIKPVIMFQQTVHHWEIEQGAPTNMYVFERIEDPDTGLIYWNVKEGIVPTDAIIPIDTVIVIAHPKNIHIPIGITLTDAGQNLLLPTIYTRKNNKIVDDALYILNLSHLFGQLNPVYSKQSSSYTTKLKE